jgi:hypothetical protein
LEPEIQTLISSVIFIRKIYHRVRFNFEFAVFASDMFLTSTIILSYISHLKILLALFNQEWQGKKLIAKGLLTLLCFCFAGGIFHNGNTVTGKSLTVLVSFAGQEYGRQPRAGSPYFGKF